MLTAGPVQSPLHKLSHRLFVSAGIHWEEAVAAAGIAMSQVGGRPHFLIWAQGMEVAGRGWGGAGLEITFRHENPTMLKGSHRKSPKENPSLTLFFHSLYKMFY